MSKRFVVLEVNPQIRLLVDYLEHVQSRLATPINKSKETAMKLIEQIAAEALGGYLAFKTSTGFDVAMAAALFGKPENKITDTELEILKSIKENALWDGIKFEILNQIEHHVERQTYIDWRVIHTAGLIGLAEGQDHRINEYYRLSGVDNGDDNAKLALNCANPINYLLNEFNKTFAVAIHEQIAYYTSAHQSACMNSNVPEEIRSSLRTTLHHLMNPTEQIVAIFLDTLVGIYPMINLHHTCPKLNEAVFMAIGIKSVEDFKVDVIAKVITAFGLHYFTTNLKRDKRYDLEYSSCHILAVYEKQFSNPKESEIHELIQALINGDYLPARERAMAERLYQEQHGR